MSESKLPQARMYLKTAKWGIDQLVEKKLEGAAFRLHLIGILAALRTTQFALYNHDRHLSSAHRKVIEDWWKSTPLDGPELSFIKMARDQILKEGSFEAYAIYTESGTGEGTNRTVTQVDYDLAYYVEGTRHELLPKLISAAAWCEHELTSIEEKLPA